MTKIFFSYSQIDHDLVEIYLDALVLSGVVSRDEVFCFERPGAQGTTGRVIAEDVREAIGAPMAVAIISSHYLASSYCVGEFGYLRFSRGITGGALAPILIPPLTSGSVPQLVSDVGLLDGFGTVATLTALLDLTARALGRVTNHGLWETVRVQAAERLIAVHSARPEPSPSPVELCDLPQATLGKILAVRQSRLSRREQEWFYERFQELEPRYHIPSAPVATDAVQEKMERQRPLDDRILSELGAAFEIPLPELVRPISATLKDAIQASVGPLTEEIFNCVRSGAVLTSPRSAQAIAYRRLYDYLSAEEILASRTALADSNVLLVPGARVGHVFRADEAARITRLSPNLYMIVLSGGHPIYDDEHDLPFGEADALSYRLLTQHRGLPEHLQVHIDGRARTTAETIAHLRVHLNPLVAELGKPVTLTLITSPYHMRRFYYLAHEAIFPALTHLVTRLQGSVSNASVDWGVIAHPQAAADLPRAKYGIGVYVQELAKLYGGRATGEF